MRTPNAPQRPVGPLPEEWIRLLLPDDLLPRSWFNFWRMPGISVLKFKASESKADLEEALTWVENEIEYMISQGIPQRNIVVAGASQGGALTLYTALHTKYKIGGFIGIVTWAPLLKSEPPSSVTPTPVNKYTPIFHMNGKLDPIVPLVCGWATKKAFKKVFPNYKLKTVVGTHLTSVNP